MFFFRKSIVFVRQLICSREFITIHMRLCVCPKTDRTWCHEILFFFLFCWHPTSRKTFGHEKTASEVHRCIVIKKYFLIREGAEKKSLSFVEDERDKKHERFIYFSLLRGLFCVPSVNVCRLRAYCDSEVDKLLIISADKFLNLDRIFHRLDVKITTRLRWHGSITYNTHVNISKHFPERVSTIETDMRFLFWAGYVQLWKSHIYHHCILCNAYHDVVSHLEID